MSSGIKLGLAVLCAVVFSAASSISSASASTAVVCANNGGFTEFADQHCLNSHFTIGPPGFVHLPIPANTPTATTVTNANTANGTLSSSTTKVKGSIAGVETEVQCTGGSGSGTLENKEEGATMWAQGTGTLNLSGCTVTKPAGKGCVVSGGAITTKKLFSTTKGLTNQVEIKPNEGTEFAGIKIESCSIAALNNTFPLTGKLIADTSGATTSWVHLKITALAAFFFGGNKAGIEGALTVKDSNAAGVVTT